MEFDIIKHTIFLTIHGSYAYGTSRPGSDVDIKGIAIPSPPYFFGFSNKFEQFEGQIPSFKVGGVEFRQHVGEIIGREVPGSEKIDSVVYDIRKFFSLAAACNPNIIEVLFGEENEHIITTQFSDKLMDNRHLFLSTKAKYSFSGYAFSQLKRIKTHRRWLLNPPGKKPERSDFGLPECSTIPRDQLSAAESMIKRKVDEWLFLDDELPREVLDSVRQKTVGTIRDIWAGLAAECYVLQDGEYLPFIAPIDEFDDPDLNKFGHAAGNILGYESNFLELLDRERHYRGSLKEWKQYNKWKKERNPDRAKTEAKFGYDTKHASHLKRLLDMAKEILTEGKVIVKRPDVEELAFIRSGGWEYDRLVEWANERQRELDVFYDAGKSPLPKKPNVKKLNVLCEELVRSAFDKGEKLRSET
jgi:predicted nucleotidyltransferase